MMELQEARATHAGGGAEAAAEAWRSMSSVQGKVYALCLGFTNNAADARDLTQDTFARALEHYRRDHPECAQAWILRIAHNLCIDHLRRQKTRGRQQPVSEGTAIDWRTPEDLANAQEEIRLVRQAIAKMPPGMRAVLVLHEYQDLSCQEIGRLLHLGRGTVASRLHRARQAVLHHVQESALAVTGARRIHDLN
jgi:RNA polymerase sigma-70 factor (ECF subfamily)